MPLIGNLISNISKGTGDQIFSCTGAAQAVYGRDGWENISSFTSPTQNLGSGTTQAPIQQVHSQGKAQNKESCPQPQCLRGQEPPAYIVLHTGAVALFALPIHCPHWEKAACLWGAKRYFWDRNFLQYKLTVSAGGACRFLQGLMARDYERLAVIMQVMLPDPGYRPSLTQVSAKLNSRGCAWHSISVCTQTVLVAVMLQPWWARSTSKEL